MSLSSGLIAAVALVYMAILFAIAFWGDRRKTPLSPRLRAWVFSLSLAVYCTSWTFFGAVGQAANQLWSFLPIYLGPVLLMLLAPWVLQKMVAISKQENITSIADFIAARYGKSQSLAVVVGADLPGRRAALYRPATQSHRPRRQPALRRRRRIGGRSCSGHGTDRQPGAGAIHHSVWYPQPGCHRAPPWHGAGGGLRIADQAAGLPRGWRLRHLGPVRWAGRSVRPGTGRAAAAGLLAKRPAMAGAARSGRRGHDRPDVPAAPVPCHRGGEHRQPGSADGPLGISGLPHSRRTVRCPHCLWPACCTCPAG